MKKPRRPSHTKAFYLRHANAAREIAVAPITSQELAEIDPADRDTALKLAAEKLRSTVFEKIRPTETVEAYLLGCLYLQTFRTIIAARQPNVVQEISIPFLGLSQVVPLTETGKVKTVHSSTLFFGYRVFLNDLEQFLNADRLKQCSQCGKIFEGRKNSLYCGELCGQKKWRQENPEDYQFIQQKSLENKKSRRRAASSDRERLAVSKISDEIATLPKRKPRPGGVLGKLSD